jgi:hypothetical protein
MNTPHPNGTALDPECIRDGFLAMKWRTVPGSLGPARAADETGRRREARETPPIEARWQRRFVSRNVRAADELNETFLRFTRRAPGFPRAD